MVDPVDSWDEEVAARKASQARTRQLIKSQPIRRPPRSSPARTARKRALAGWHVYDWEQNAKFPSAPGCYAFYIEGRLAYIGQSENVRKRLAQYGTRWSYSPTVLTQWGQFDTFLIKIRIYRRYGEWAMRELRLLRRLRPGLNYTGCSRKWTERHGLVPQGMRRPTAPEDAPADVAPRAQ